MDTCKEFMKLHSTRKHLLSYHHADVTPEMESILKMNEPHLRQRALHTNTSITLIDLENSRYNFHSSVHKRNLAFTAINPHQKDNWDQLYHLIHRDDRHFYYESDIMGYRYLMACAPEQRKSFEMLYTLRLKNKRGGYSVYLFRVYVWLSDERNEPWLLICESKELPMCQAEDFQPYRQFCLLFDETHEVIKRFDARNKNEFTKTQVERIKLMSKNITMKELANIANRSEKTLRNGNTDIYKRLNVSTGSDSNLLAKWLRII